MFPQKEKESNGKKGKQHFRWTLYMRMSREFMDDIQGIVWSFAFLAVCFSEGSLFLA